MTNIPTPHQYHQRAGSVKKTAAHVKRVETALARERNKDKTRSPKWPAVRKKFLAKVRVAGSGCAACGNKAGLQVHHRRPFHLHPELELVESNLVAMCMTVGGLECHLKLAHGASFRAYVPIIDDLCSALRADPTQLSALRKRARESRLTV